MEETTTTTKSTDMVLGVFNQQTQAETAIEALKNRGYDPKEISVIMKDTEQATDLEDNTGANVADGAASGAVTGGALGALAGVLVGIGAIVIPGIGGVLIGGPIAAALGLGGAAATTATGAITGAVAGGLVGALVGLGVPEESAKTYQESVKAGAILLAVPTLHEATHIEVKGILEGAGANQVTEVHA